MKIRRNIKTISKTLVILCLLSLIASVFMLTSMAQEETDCHVYTPRELQKMLETKGNVTAKTVFDGETSAISIINNGITQNTNEYVKFNFHTNDSFTPEYLIKEYPFVAISYKTDASFTDMSINAGMKVASTGKYERCWGLRTGGIKADEAYHKVIYDLSTFNAYDGGLAKWENITENSGIKYIRIPVWAHTPSISASAGEYFNIKYIGFFKSREDAEAFALVDIPYHIYEASQLRDIVSIDGNLTSEFIFDGDTTAIQVVNNGIKIANNEYILLDFLPPYLSESKFDPALMIREYPYLVISYKTDANLSAISINAGMKVSSTGKYERCWGLRTSGISAASEYQKAIYDLSSFNSYDGGQATWENITSDSGIKYLRIPVWAHSNDLISASGEYLNIQYIGFFKSDTEAKAFVYGKDRFSPLGDADSNGSVQPADSISLARYLANWTDYTDKTVNLSALDLNADGKISTLDSVLLSRHLSSWKGYRDIAKYNPQYYLPEYAKKQDLFEMPGGLIEELDRKFAERVAKIRASASQYTVGSGATVYYVANNGNDNNNGRSQSAPFKTLAKVESMMAAGTIKTGDIVLLRRGDEWHYQLTITRGITLSAYGTGVKPRIFGSIEADNASQWILTDSANVYKFNEEMPTTKDVGNIVFNEGECYGMRVIKNANNKTLPVGRENITSNGIDQWEFPVQTFTSYKDLTAIGDSIPKADLMFYHDRENKVLYLYSRNGNPGNRFSSIEICQKGHAIRCNSSNVTVDNIMFGFTGSHGLSAGSLHNLTVRNCEIGWIGGSVQNEDVYTRFGNAVEIYGKADGYYVYDNYMYQCFDCGPTIQVAVDLAGTSNQVFHRNVAFYGNALAEASLEIWLSSTPANTSSAYSILENCRMYDNYVTMSGYGWKGYNHQKNEYTSFYGGGETHAEFKNCYMENNYFWNLRRHLLKATATNTREGLGFHWRNNVIIKENNSYLGHLGTDIEDSTGFGIYKYNEKTLSEMLETGALGENTFYYLPDDYDYEVNLKFGKLE